MNWKLKSALGATALILATQAAAQITFYEGEGFRGRTFTTDRQVGNFEREGFNDRASSVVVEHGRWEVCEDARFAGRCTVLRPGRYESLSGMGMNNRISSVRQVDERARNDNEAPAQGAAHITFYEGEGFRGRTFATDKQVGNFQRFGFNDRASSVVVERGRWEVCDDAGFAGNCRVLRRGNYESLSGMGMNNRISSVRPVAERERYSNDAPAPVAAAPYEYRRRPEERVFDVPVTSVRAVVGQPSERCWMEHQPASEPVRGGPNVGGAVIGAVIGGVLGHQVGGGRGQDVATVGGAVAGGVVGANVGRNSGGTPERDVKRCETTASTTPEYWDVTYNFRGVEHRIQMSAAPGPTVAVNGNGEPRQ